MVGKDCTFVVVFGVPTYINGYAAIPLVAGLIKSGKLSGPALAFVTAGAVTFVTRHHWGLASVKRMILLWHLLLITVGSLVLRQSFQFNIQFS